MTHAIILLPPELVEQTLGAVDAVSKERHRCDGSLNLVLADVKHGYFFFLPLSDPDDWLPDAENSLSQTEQRYMPFLLVSLQTLTFSPYILS
jgi:hypothetical protein